MQPAPGAQGFQGRPYGRPDGQQGGAVDPRGQHPNGYDDRRGPGNDPNFRPEQQQGRPAGNWAPDRGDGYRDDRGNGYRDDRGNPAWNRPGTPGGQGGYRPGDPNGYRPGNPGWNRPAGGPGWRGPDWRQDRRYDWRGFRDQHREIFRAQRYVAPRGWAYGYRRFEIGFRLPPFLFGADYWIADPWMYRLPPVDGPYRWVRYYNDVLLIDLRSGEVVDEIPDFFW